MSIESKEQWRLWRSFLNHRTLRAVRGVVLLGFSSVDGTVAGIDEIPNVTLTSYL